MFNRIVSDIEQYLGQFNFIELCLQIIYLQWMNQPDMALNNLQWLVYRKTKANLWDIFGLVLFSFLF